MDQGSSQRDVIAIVRRRRWPVLAAIFAGLALASAASMAVPKSYRSTTRIEVSANRTLSAAEFATKVEAVSAQILSVKSMEGVVSDLKLEGEDAESLIGSTRVEREEPANGACLLRVEHSARDPQSSFRILGRIVGGYRHELYDRPRLEAQQAVDLSKKAVEAASARVAAVQAILDRYQTENADFLGQLDRQLADVQRELQSIEEQEFKDCRERIKEAEEVLKTEPKNREQRSKKVDPVRLAAIDSELSRVRSKLVELTDSRRLADEHPEVRTTKSAITDLEKQRADLEQSAEVVVALVPSQLHADYTKRLSDAKSALSVAEMRAAGLRKNEKLLQDKQRSAPPVRAQRDKLAADVAAAAKSEGELKAALSKAEEHLRTVADERQLNFRTVDEPAPPRSPAGAPPAIFALGGLVVGAAAGLGLAWILDAQDRSFREVDAVAAFIGAPALGAIGRIETAAEATAVRTKTVRAAGMVAALGFFAVVLAGASLWFGSSDAGAMTDAGAASADGGGR